jgi:hypothetical protein
MALLDGTLVRATSSSLAIRWSTQVDVPAGPAMLLLRGGRLALISGAGVTVFDATSGGAITSWKASHVGVLQGACSSSPGVVMFASRGVGTVYFDVAAGHIVEWAKHCALVAPPKEGTPASLRRDDAAVTSHDGQLVVVDAQDARRATLHFEP